MRDGEGVRGDGVRGWQGVAGGWEGGRETSWDALASTGHCRSSTTLVAGTTAEQLQLKQLLRTY